MYRVQSSDVLYVLSSSEVPEATSDLRDDDTVSVTTALEK